MKNNDLIYSTSLSVLFVLIGGVYFYQHYLKDETQSDEKVQSTEISSAINYNNYDSLLIDTLTDFTIKEYEIWELLYPNGKLLTNVYGGFSKKVMAGKMSDVNKSSNYFHKSIHRVFYYKNSGKQKAFVVLVSYLFDEEGGNRNDCHGCSPNYDIVNFVYEDGAWHLENHIINWGVTMGAWGYPVQLEFGMSELGYTLEMDNCFCQAGHCECYNVLYDIPSLKLIKEKTTETNDNTEVSPYTDIGDSIEVEEPELVDSLE